MLLMKSKFTVVIIWDQEELTKMNQPFTKIFFRVIQDKRTHFANPFFSNILFQYPHETINNDFRGYREERLG